MQHKPKTFLISRLSKKHPRAPSEKVLHVIKHNFKVLHLYIKKVIFVSKTFKNTKP